MTGTTGQPGAAGTPRATGATGSTGATGPAGPSDAYSYNYSQFAAIGTAPPVSGASATLLSLPAGSYDFTWHMTIQDEGTSTTPYVFCIPHYATVGKLTATSEAFDAGLYASTGYALADAAFHELRSFTAQTTVTMTCSQTGTGTVTFHDFDVTVLTVGAAHAATGGLSMVAAHAGVSPEKAAG
jgi:hypothetical protein